MVGNNPTLLTGTETPISVLFPSFPSLPPDKVRPLYEMVRRIKGLKGFPLDFPVEMVEAIGAQIDTHVDFLNFREATILFRNCTDRNFGKYISNMTIYPCKDQMTHILRSLRDPYVAQHVRKITLLAEGHREHEYGYVWAWEDVQVWGGINFTPGDIDIINKINIEHANARDKQCELVYSGRYRAYLHAIFKACFRLKHIHVRKLAPGEQIPGWDGAEMFKDLSFYHDELDTRNIFYGDWQYDTVHGRVTHYQDEFGDVIMEPDAGPQASFMDDFRIAKRDSGCKAKVTYKATSRR
ncbi:hypothetical protein B5807_02807 [Epicoccum nigrum]|uniref:Uncharacterized protein n=1 Tax=Epicoccum nigrum TaxID=105696 RepID=A0A1Y2M8I1_EPING|nr:hypothetical protein B5807_02807 [Epicoccum nigrum]